MSLDNISLKPIISLFYSSSRFFNNVLILIILLPYKMSSPSNVRGLRLLVGLKTGHKTNFVAGHSNLVGNLEKRNLWAYALSKLAWKGRLFPTAFIDHHGASIRIEGLSSPGATEHQNFGSAHDRSVIYVAIGVHVDFRVP